MKIKLLPSTIDGQHGICLEQRLTCFLIDDRLAIDAGSIALALTNTQRATVRDIIITHSHIDHIATLPIFFDDLFESLDAPVRVYATGEVIQLLERDIFNWTVYPRFSELSNGRSRIMEYIPFSTNEEFQVAHLRVTAVAVSHTVPTVGMIISDGRVTVAFTSDTAETEEFWQIANRRAHIDALIIESSFPNALGHIAKASGHLTPASVDGELRKLQHLPADVFAVHLKPSYRERVVEELGALGVRGLRVMEPGREYEW